MPQQQQQQQQQSGPRPNDRQFYQGKNYNRCFNCGSTSHFAKNCPQPKKSFSSQNSNQNKGKKQVMKDKQGWLNFTTLTKFPEDTPIMTGNFSIHPKPIVTLLDSGSWTFTIQDCHSFSILESQDEILFRGEGCDTSGVYHYRTQDNVCIVCLALFVSVRITEGSDPIHPLPLQGRTPR